MRPTCTAPMHTETKQCERGMDAWRQKRQMKKRAFVLTEIIVVIAIISMFAVLAMVNIPGLINTYSFKSEVSDIISTLRMAITSAAENDKKYEVIFDITEQIYTLREITSPDLSEIFAEDIIQTSRLSNKCTIYYVQFDDFESTLAEDSDELKAVFRAGRTGWEYGGKIVLLDSEQQTYSIIVNRLSRTVEMQKGEVELLIPKHEDELPF